MGFRYRKSINLGGGFRINLSKSGIGYSWGTKGYRVTRTARGTTRRTYSIPGTGLSYTQESGRGTNNRRSNPTRSRQNNPSLRQRENDYRQQPINSGYEPAREIASGNIEQFQSAEATNIVSSIHRTIALDFWGTILIIGILLMVFNPLFVVLPVAGVTMKILAHTVAVVDLEYSFDAEAEEEHNRRMDAWTILAEGDKEWQITSEQFNSNTKAHAGANRSINRIPCTIKKGRPFYIKTNVDSIEIKLKNETLIILPDKVFVIRGKKVGLVDYKDFSISVSSSNFRENEKVPGDARVVGSTWQFVNANGTPDRRYKNNRQIPICLYGTVRLYSAGGAGINVELMTSNIQKAQDFRDLVV